MRTPATDTYDNENVNPEYGLSQQDRYENTKNKAIPLLPYIAENREK